MEATVHVQPVINLDDEQFYELCQLNRDLRLERNAQGDVVIMPPVVGETSDQNAEITMQLRLWAKRDATGTTFDSSGGFLLPNGTVRSPDASWIEKARLEALDAEERQRFIPLCPSFVIELRSPADRLRYLQENWRSWLKLSCALRQHALPLSQTKWRSEPALCNRVIIARLGMEVEYGPAITYS